jgi:sigma-E factor negative regulatory protein RseB
MADAYHSRTFEGRFLYMRGAEVSTLSLKHAVIDGKEYERLTHLTGRPTEVIRAGGKAVCIHPDSSVTLLPDSSGAAPFDLAQRLMRQVPGQYDVLLDGDGRVAGREAWRIRLAPLDDHRFGYRLWVDRDSRLLLKSEMVDGGALPLERIEFITLELEPGLTAEDFRMPVPASRDDPLPAQRAQAGIRLETGWLPGGFVDAARNDHQPVNGREALTSVTYSDGLATFTLFVESGSRDTGEGISRMGPTVAITRRMNQDEDRYAVTLVGEIPQHTAERILEGLVLRESVDD